MYLGNICYWREEWCFTHDVSCYQ